MGEIRYSSQAQSASIREQISVIVLVVAPSKRNMFMVAVWDGELQRPSAKSFQVEVFVADKNQSSCGFIAHLVVYKLSYHKSKRTRKRRCATNFPGFRRNAKMPKVVQSSLSLVS